MKHCIVYVPGLGDGYDATRRFLLAFWRIYGVTVRHVPMRWNDGGDYATRAQAIQKTISEAQNQGYTVSLIGESAGGSMALNVAAESKNLHTVLTLAGVNSPAMFISPHTYKKAPAFSESMKRLAQSRTKLDTTRVHTVRSVSDHVVPARYTIIAGAHNHRIFVLGHITAITLFLTLFSGYIVRLIKTGV